MAKQSAAPSTAPHAADVHDLIRVHGARVNNLKDVNVEIPKRRLTVFTGVSGSGKSSLVFDTIAAESQRLINETYSAFVQGFMPARARPEVDVLEGLTTAISVDQQRMGGDARSTVGTATDANAMLRILFSRLGEPHIGSPNAFSFNVPSVKASGEITIGEKTVNKTFTRTGGMCPRCEGLGTASDIDLSQLYDASKSLAEGALTHPRLHGGRLELSPVCRLGLQLQLLGLLDGLVEAGKSVIVIEHHQAVMAHADWIIDLGPGAGHDGGRVVFTGTPADLVADRITLTGEHLAAYVGAGPDT